MVLVIGSAMIASGALAGCAPTPAPTPTPTAAFASEEEAFAAAEEVYRAYNEALNQERTNKGSIDPRDYLSGPALSSDLETSRLLKEQGLTLAGTSIVKSFEGLTVDAEGAIPSVVAQVCLDVSQASVLNADGVNVTPINRPTTVLMRVTFGTNAAGLLITNSMLARSEPC